MRTLVRTVRSLSVAVIAPFMLSIAAGAQQSVILKGDSSRTIARTDSSATLSGVITDTAGRPLLGGQIASTDGVARAVSGDSGMFVLSGLKPGKMEFTVRALGYTPVAFTSDLRAGKIKHVRVELTPVSVRLATVTVVDSMADAALRSKGFFDRSLNGMGTFLTPDKLEAMHATMVSDFLRTVPGLSMRPAAGGTLPVSTRGATLHGAQCLMNLFIDGGLVQIGDVHDIHKPPHPTTIEDVIPAGFVGAIEVYPGPAETPLQFRGPSVGCGAVVIWTKSWR